MNPFLYHTYAVTNFTKQDIYKNISAIFQSKMKYSAPTSLKFNSSFSTR